MVVVVVSAVSWTFSLWSLSLFQPFGDSRDSKCPQHCPHSQTKPRYEPGFKFVQKSGRCYRGCYRSRGCCWGCYGSRECWGCCWECYGSRGCCWGCYGSRGCCWGCGCYEGSARNFLFRGCFSTDRNTKEKMAQLYLVVCQLYFRV